MSDVAALIADMVRAGVDPDLIGRTAAALSEREPVKIIDEQAERRRAKDRERKRLRNSAETADPSPQGSLSPEPPILPNPQPIPPSPPKGGSSPIDRAIEVFSEEAKRANLPAPRKVTPDRRRKIEARLREHGESVWAEACRKMADSPFCRGENDRGWRADLDFLCQPKSFNGLIEGKYDARPFVPQQSTDPPRKPRNAGELSYQQLMGQTDEYTSESDRRLGSGDGDAETPNLGSFQKFAISGDFLRRM